MQHSDDDAFWDDLGISWRASIPDAGLVSSRLRARLKRQSAVLGALTAAGLVAGVLGFALAAWTLWIGWSGQTWNIVARGLTLAVVSLVALLATASVRMRHGGDARSLRDMLEVSTARTQRLIRAADLGCLALIILAVGGMAGYAIRVRLYRPPSMSPVENLLLLALAGLALVSFRWSQSRSLARRRHLSRVFASDDAKGAG
jgi:hypothetical protein